MEFGSRLLKINDEGPDVAILQRKLKSINIYSGRVDGIFGENTKIAVKNFQRANKITIDGIVGKNTYKLFPKESLYSRMSYLREDIILLARIINGEARGENFKGKTAVGAVILNRVKSNKFPDTIREVILQKGQFSSLIDGQANLYPVKSSIAAARAALIGYDPTFGALFFYNPVVATNKEWIETRPVIKKIGDHIFAR